MALGVTPGNGADIDTELVGGVHRMAVNTRGSLDTNTFSNADVDALETLAEIDVSRAQVLTVSFTTTVALTAFSVAYRVHASGSYFEVANTALDFTDPAGAVLGCSGDLTAAGVGPTHWVMLDVTGVQAVRLQAASSSASVSGFYGMQ